MNRKGMAKNRAYSDIIDHPRHQSATRPHMSLHDRAAQFSPFAALVGYNAAVEEAGRLTERQIILDEDAVTRLDETMRELLSRESAHPEITVTCFVRDERKEGGSYVGKSGEIKRIDTYRRCIVFIDGSEVSFGDIIDIRQPDPF